MDPFIKLYNLLGKSERLALIKISFLSLVASAFDIATVLTLAPLLNSVATNNNIKDELIGKLISENLNLSDDYQTLLCSATLALIILISSLYLKIILIKQQSIFVWSQEAKISTKIYQSYLAKSYVELSNLNTAKISATLLHEVSQLTHNMLIPGIAIVVNAIFILSITTFLITINPTISITAFLLFAMMYLLVYIRIKNKARALGDHAKENAMSRYKIVSESLEGFKLTKSEQLEIPYFNNFKSQSENYVNNQGRNQVLSHTPRYLIEGAAFSFVIVSVMIFSHSSFKSDSLFTTVAIFGLAGLRLLPAFQQIFRGFTIFNFSNKILENISRELSDVNVLHVCHPDSKMRVNLIKFENVAFKYKSQNYGLSDISFEIKKGDWVAVVGETGSGKSTLINLITGLIEQTSGVFQVDEKVISPGNISSWKKKVGYVPQDLFLLDGTISENISLAKLKDEKIKDNGRVRKCAEIAQIRDFIETQLQDQYDTLVGERGVKLSGGQKQRLGIARALYKEPQVLIFDEATSALDMETEKRLMDAIHREYSNLTVIMIAHRPYSLQYCNKVFTVKNGCLSDDVGVSE